MAILDKFEAWVRVDRKRLQEYDDGAAAATAPQTGGQSSFRTSKYIEARNGQNYVICFKILPGLVFESDMLRWQVHIDGREITSPLMFKDEYIFWSTFARSSSGIYTTEADGARVLHWFQFSDLKFQDDGPENQDSMDEPTDESLGTIIIKVFWQNHRWCSTTPGTRRVRQRCTQVEPEKAVKGDERSLYTKLSPPIRKDQYSFGMTDQVGAPLAVFTFKYRSRRALQDLEVIPGTPRTTTPEAFEERDIDKMNEEGAKDLAKRLLRRQQDLKKANALERDSRKRKRESASPERPVRKIKVDRTHNGEDRIDLDFDEGD